MKYFEKRLPNKKALARGVTSSVSAFSYLRVSKYGRLSESLDIDCGQTITDMTMRFKRVRDNCLKDCCVKYFEKWLPSKKALARGVN